MKSLLLIPVLWIFGCSVQEASEHLDEVKAASVVAQEDEPSSTPPVTPKESKPCPHHTPIAGAECSTDDHCYYAVEDAYAIITLTECRCVASEWACFPP